MSEPALDLPDASGSEFDRGVSVVRRSADPTAYDGELSADWQIGAGINGGLLVGVVANALRDALAPTGHSDPFAVSAYYLSASRPGPAVVRTEVLRTGGSMSTVQASMLQDTTERLRVLATFGDLSALPDDVHTSATPPEMPPPEECVSSGDAPPGMLSDQTGLLRRLDLRLDPTCVGWAVGQPSGRGLIQGWLRMADGREPDPLLLLLAVDALPPVAFDLGRVGWTPTLELSTHVRAEPAPGWLRVSHRTRNVAGGMLEEDAEVWDSAGRLVAQSRQLARMPRDRPAG